MMMRDIFVGHHVDQQSSLCPAPALTWIKKVSDANGTAQEAECQLMMPAKYSSGRLSFSVNNVLSWSLDSRPRGS
jgi:hypothetical protein